MKELALFFRVLSEPIRLRILNILQQGEHCVCNLVKILDLPQSTISRHLATLKSSGLITARKNGLWHYYRLTGQNPNIAMILPLIRESNDPVLEKDQERLRTAGLCVPEPEPEPVCNV